MRLITTLAALALSTPAIAQTDPLSRAETLPKIFAEMEETFSDAESVKGLTMCAPDAIKRSGDRITGWRIYMSMNVKNANGGYDGQTMYAATFRDGKRVRIVKIEMEGEDAFAALINREIRKKLIGCERVPNSEVQAVLAGIYE